MLPHFMQAGKNNACTSVEAGQRYVIYSKQNKLVCLYLGG